MDRPLLRLALLLALLVLSQPLLAQTRGSDWVATWITSPQPADPDDAEEPLLHIENQTVRERIRVSLGGTRVRLRLSNEQGSTPLIVGAATVAGPADPAGVIGPIPVTFGGQPAVTIPAGAPMLSDPIPFPVKDGGEIAVSLYFPGRLLTPTLHSLALKHSVVSAPGDFTRAQTVIEAGRSESSMALTGVLVPARTETRVVVAFGDSVTDGDASTPEADRTWPSDLARRIAGLKHSPSIAVGNAGIAGNRLLADGFGSSGLARFDRDVLAVPGLTHVIVLEGTNDLAFPGATLQGNVLEDPAHARSAQDLIGAYRQLIERAHAAGIKIIGATLLPFEGARLPGYFSASKDAERALANDWIRSGGAYDGVIDFDALLRDPDHPSRLLARYASADHMHPNDAGYQVMADAIDLTLFRTVKHNRGAHIHDEAGQERRTRH